MNGLFILLINHDVPTTTFSYNYELGDHALISYSSEKENTLTGKQLSELWSFVILSYYILCACAFICISPNDVSGHLVNLVKYIAYIFIQNISVSDAKIRLSQRAQNMDEGELDLFSSVVFSILIKCVSAGNSLWDAGSSFHMHILCPALRQLYYDGWKSTCGWLPSATVVSTLRICVSSFRWNRQMRENKEWQDGFAILEFETFLHVH